MSGKRQAVFCFLAGLKSYILKHTNPASRYRLYHTEGLDRLRLGHCACSIWQYTRLGSVSRVPRL